jgi:FkbH-like protein
MREDEKLKKLFFKFEKIFQERSLLKLESHELLRLANQFSKIENIFQENKADSIISKKIAIVSSSTTYFFKQILKLFLFQDGINAIFYEADYGSIHEQILNEQSELYSFSPDVLLILPDYRDIHDHPPLFSNYDEIEALVKSHCIVYHDLWSRISNRLKHCQIFHGLYVIPHFRTLGALDGNYIFSPQNYFRLINLELIKNRPTNVIFIDFDYHASNIGKLKWFDDSQYFQSKQAISFDSLGEICYAVSRLISSYFGKLKKCLVLDLDNTLWGGVIGDDGLEGINIDSHNPEGEAYLAFQCYIKSLKSRGVILAVCSKNEENIAKSPFNEHPEMILKLEDFSCFIANWNDKSSNIRNISIELNIGINSIVFFDDNPAEREIVAKFLPEVEVIDTTKDPAMYISALDQSRCFDWVQLTNEDVQRSDTYTKNKNRLKLQESFIDYDEYLESLNMKAVVGSVSSINQTRFTQLINKTNQFNLRTKRYPESTIDDMLSNLDKFNIIQISFEDKFGSYGLISSIILERFMDKAFINTWVMSCRVFKRGIEHLALSSIVEAVSNWGCDEIVGEYIQTPKNGVVKSLYDDLGFNYNKQYSLDNQILEGDIYCQSIKSDKFQTQNHINI